MLISSFDKTIHMCKIVGIVQVGFDDTMETLSNASFLDTLSSCEAK